jgi:metal-responsive CopG/Arc/MetJ family transcriptional regulator
MTLKRFGVSLEDELLKALDQYVEENGIKHGKLVMSRAD